MILVLYFQRLLLFRAPPRDIILSVFLALGPLGQGGEALIRLGQGAFRLMPIVYPSGIGSGVGNGIVTEGLTIGKIDPECFGYAIYGSSLISGLLLWGFGAWWAVVGLMTVIRERRANRLPFNMGVSILD